jgi:hypothetical protein
LQVTRWNWKRGFASTQRFCLGLRSVPESDPRMNTDTRIRLKMASGIRDIGICYRKGKDRDYKQLVSNLSERKLFNYFIRRSFLNLVGNGFS